MRIENHDFSIGADPELFVKKEGQFVSGYNLIPGTKDKPFPVPKGAVQVDGMALEFNIDPADNQADFLRNIDTVLQSLTKMTSQYELAFEPVANFGKSYIEGQPDIAKTLGCDPDWNAYEMAPNPAPDAGADFRTASGHVHIGWTRDRDPLEPTHFEACAWLARTLDVYLGIPSLLWDGDTKRRSLYGKAGSFRPKHYGMEYRTLSNKWLIYPELRALVFGNTIEAIKELFRNEKIIEKKFFNNKTAREIIDSGDEETAINLMSYESINSPKFYREQLGIPKRI